MEKEQLRRDFQLVQPVSLCSHEGDNRYPSARRQCQRARPLGKMELRLFMDTQEQREWLHVALARLEQAADWGVYRDHLLITARRQ